MGKIFYLSFLTIYAVFLQEMVAAFDENTELSSVPHIRQKRMNYQPGSSSSSSHVLPPWFEDLKKVNMKNPTPVEIISEDSANTGYAIHPYFVLTRLEYTIHGFRLFVHMKNSGLLEVQHVRICMRDELEELVLIQLTNPLMLNNPILGAFSAEHYSPEATAWAKVQVRNWIRRYQPDFQEPPQQSLTEFRYFDPTKVAVTKNGTYAGPGFAIHPHFVIASRRFIQKPVGVLSYPATTGELRPHRVQNVFMVADIGVIRLRDPISLTLPVPAALHTAQFSLDGIAYAIFRVQDWIQEFNARRNRARNDVNRV